MDVELLAPASEQLVHVGLMAYVEEEVVLRSVKDVVHRDRQFDDAKIRSKMAARARENRDQLLADLCR